MKNLLQNLPTDLPQELVETLLRTESVHIERIVSRGHTSPRAGWYDQECNEFVLLVQGAARLAFEDGRDVSMGPGDWVVIAARQKHRVSWTDPERDSVWLAVHYR